jgi:hypothetical protein
LEAEVGKLFSRPQPVVSKSESGNGELIPSNCGIWPKSAESLPASSKSRDAVNLTLVAGMCQLADIASMKTDLPALEWLD